MGDKLLVTTENLVVVLFHLMSMYCTANALFQHSSHYLEKVYNFKSMKNVNSIKIHHTCICCDLETKELEVNSIDYLRQ